jgi:hypothetical protein
VAKDKELNPTSRGAAARTAADSNESQSQKLKTILLPAPPRPFETFSIGLASFRVLVNIFFVLSILTLNSPIEISLRLREKGAAPPSPSPTT